MKPYRVGPMFGQAVRDADTMQEAEDVAQYLADEYLITYVAWSVKSMEPTFRGTHQQITTCYPTRRIKRTRKK